MAMGITQNELDVVARLEVEGGRPALRPDPHLDVVLLACALRDRGVGDVGDEQPEVAQVRLQVALARLKSGEYTQSPVQSSSGWHVIQLVATRDRAPPSFEGVQDQVKRRRAA
jgi:hypothetical protein